MQQVISVRDTLAQFQNQQVFFEPLKGNNGDKLIQLGSEYLLDQMGLPLVNRPDEADVIVINGGGGLAVEFWNQEFQTLKEYSQGFPHTPLVVLPSSYYFKESDFPGCFHDRSAPTYLFARERYSLNLLYTQSFPSKVYLGLDDDMAFALQGSPFLDHLKANARQDHILIVERFDLESATGQPQAQQFSDDFKRLFPKPLRTALSHLNHKRRAAGTGFKQAALNQVFNHYPQFKGLPVVDQDVSKVEFTFEEFTGAIATSQVVVTTRLHVAILAVMLGKITFIKLADGAYPKVKGCYEQSMAMLSNVHVW